MEKQKKKMFHNVKKWFLENESNTELKPIPFFFHSVND